MHHDKGSTFWLYVTLFTIPGNGVQSIFTEVDKVKFDVSHRTSGLAVCDVDHDGDLEVIVAGLDGPNMVMKYDKTNGDYINIAIEGSQYDAIMDPLGRTASVCACDVDGDGREEIYLHNINPVYGSDSDIVADKLLLWRAGGYTDLFSDPHNTGVAPRHGGHSVSCIDHQGTGTYSFFVTTYTEDGRGVYRLLGMNSSHPDNNIKDGYIVLGDFSAASGLRLERDGRGIAVGPILDSDGLSDIYITNQNSYHVGSSTFRHSGKNVLFKNNGDGTFTDIADELGITDEDENGRGVAVGDFGGSEKTDILYLNWLGANKLLIQNSTVNHYSFRNTVEDAFALPGPSSLLLVSDFNNDGVVEALRSGADDDSLHPGENQLLHVGQKNGSITLGPDSLKALQLTGIVATDMNSDGLLELIVTHKQKDDSSSLTVYRNSVGAPNNWLRFIPRTRGGAPARGSVVTITLDNGQSQKQIVSGGCGYMCQSEPVVHFGTSNTFAREVTVHWPDGHFIRKFMYPRDINKGYTISYSGNMQEIDPNKTSSTSAATSAGVINNHLTIQIISFHVLCLLYLYLNCGRV